MQFTDEKDKILQAICLSSHDLLLRTQNKLISLKLTPFLALDRFNSFEVMHLPLQFRTKDDIQVFRDYKSDFLTVVATKQTQQTTPYYFRHFEVYLNVFAKDEVGQAVETDLCFQKSMQQDVEDDSVCQTFRLVPIGVQPDPRKVEFEETAADEKFHVF